MSERPLPQVPYRHGPAGPGLAGYRKGCRCADCRKAKRDDMAAYRARRKLRENGGVAELQGQDDGPPAVEPASASLDWNAPMGPVEETLREELDKLVGEPPFKKTLVVLARYDARVLDQIPKIDRPDLISGMQSRLFNVFDRLRKVTDGADGNAVTPDQFLAGLLNDDE